MKMTDLTHQITEEMLLFPGTAPVRLERIGKPDGRQTNLFLNNHVGTHIDAPAHAEIAGKFLEELPLERFFGLALMLDVSEFRGRSIPLEFLEQHADELRFSQFLVLNSGYHKLWGTEEYMKDFPVLSTEAALYLASFPELSGVAMDMLSADPADSEELPIHHILLRESKLIVENLANLEALEGEHFLLSVLPLSFEKADASPLRAVAFQAPAGIYYPK
ncbi:MAG: cyclase family protein [Bacillota bacterium]|nr:cyclase family protein [Bacillota bacterium]